MESAKQEIKKDNGDYWSFWLFKVQLTQTL